MSIRLPLSGVRVVEFEGIGPGPLAARMLADMGAEVVTVVRPGGSVVAAQLGGQGDNPLRRGKRIETIDLKSPAGVARALDLVADADALVEGQRPGAMERLGLGPSDCAARNPRLVYGRMTGWGQHGPLSQAAGHDLNYVALTGLLSLSARAGQAPIVPPTVVGDAAGALGLAFGIACALVDVRRGGPGRVVDAAIVDIAAMLGTLVQWIRAAGQIDAGTPSPFHDSPFYDVYRCADGRWLAVGALEARFFRALARELGLDDHPDFVGDHLDRTHWPGIRAALTEVLATRTRDDWHARLRDRECCVAPVLSLTEAAADPHNAARGLLTERDGVLHPAPAPRVEPA